MTRHITTASNARSRTGSRSAVERGVHRTAGPVARDQDLRIRRIDPDDLGTQRGGPPGDLAFATADVEHAGGAGEVPVDEREDLLLVLGIGPVSELLLPPPGVLLPQGYLAHPAILLGRAQEPAAGAGSRSPRS